MTFSWSSIINMQPLPLSHYCHRDSSNRLGYTECQCPNKKCLSHCSVWSELTQEEQQEEMLIYRVTKLSQYPPYPVASEEDRQKVKEIFARRNNSQ